METPEEDIKGSLSPNIRPEAFKSLHHSGISEWLHMNKWQFLLVIERLQRKPKAPRLEHVAIPFGIFLALLLAILPVDFKYYLGIDAQVWQSITLVFTILSALVTVVLFVMWLTNTIHNKKQTPEDILNEVIRGMEAEQKKLNSVNQKPSNGVDRQDK
jgi:hypothetical protein